MEMMDNPMRAASVGREEAGMLGSSVGGLQDAADYLVPSTVQAEAYELLQVPGASEHRSSAPIYSPPEPPPPPPGWVAGGGPDYTYIDEDAPDDGYSRAVIERFSSYCCRCLRPWADVFFTRGSWAALPF